LLRAGVLLKLLETPDGKTFRVAKTCRAVLLPSAGENYLGDWPRLLSQFYVLFADLDQVVLKGGPMIDPASYFGANRERTREFILAMHNYAARRGRELAEYLDTSAATTLLDLGCGPGTYAFNLGLRNPRLQICLADLPETLATTKEIQRRYPLQNHVDYLPLDAERDDVPGSYDLILVSNMLHALGIPARIQLIRRLYHALNRGGSLVIQAEFLQDNHLGKKWPIYLDLNLLCTTQHGSNHTIAETRTWMEEAGFIDIEYCPMSVLGVNSYLRGYKK
jgi:SAM-dependent methyltransferase